MPQGGTTTIKPTAPLSMPNEQKWARELGNNRQADTVAGSLPSQNPNQELQNLNPNLDITDQTTGGLNQNLIQGISRMDTGAIKDILKQTTEIAGQQIFKEALKQSWYNLIESYGFTFIYINFHFIMAYLAKSKYFCKFGVALSFGGKMDAISKVGSGISQTLMEYAEIVILFTVNGLILFILFLIACNISLIAWAVTDPVEFLIAIGGSAQEIINLLR